jgi:uncharacterized membrane protein
MFEQTLPWLTALAALGCGLIGGLLFAFSNFVMQALAQQPAASGIATMQAINRLILNPLFLLIFMGTALMCVALAAIAMLRWSQPGAIELLIASLLYVIGCFGVTIAFNVPLNNSLANLNPDAADIAEQWRSYVAAWLRWNHVRTLASIVAAVILILHLV